MKDSELADLIRKGASSWHGQTPIASAAKFSRGAAKGPRRWRPVAIAAAAAAAALLVGLSLTPNRGIVVQTILSAVEGRNASQSPGSESASQTEPSPSSTTEPAGQPKHEPTPQRSEPSPVQKHEPAPSPEPAHSSSPAEPSPTPAGG